MFGTHRRSASLVAVAFGALSATLVGAAAPAPSKPLRIEDALGALSLAGRSPIHLSPDGRCVAYTLEDPRRRTSTGISGTSTIRAPEPFWKRVAVTSGL